MEEQNNYQALIEKEIKAAIDLQQSQMESVIQSSKKRNEYLNQQISNYTQVQPLDFPTRPDCPPHELIEQYYEAHRRLCLAQKNFDRLYHTQRYLSDRITSAHSILQKEKMEKHNRAVFALSPTVARLRDIKISQPSGGGRSAFIESTIFKEQLEAIEKLKSGTRPRQYGEIKYGFDKEMDSLDKEIEYFKHENEELLHKITTNINNFLKDPSAIQNELMQRQKDMSSFQKFAQVYYNSNNEIEKLKYTKLHQVMKTIRDDVQNKRINELYSHLSSEKEMIDEQLASFGTGDSETNQLKSEIEFQMLYLGHLTAIAGKTLSRMSTEKEPADPVDEMKAEIISMQYKLPKSNPM